VAAERSEKRQPPKPPPWHDACGATAVSVGEFVGFEFEDRDPQAIANAVLTNAKGRIASSGLASFKRALLKVIREAGSADAAAS
jgi:hypothetical protein